MKIRNAVYKALYRLDLGDEVWIEYRGKNGFVVTDGYDGTLEPRAVIFCFDNPAEWTGAGVRFADLTTDQRDAMYSRVYQAIILKLAGELYAWQQ